MTVVTEAMPDRRHGIRVVPLALAAGMLAVVIAAGLGPNAAVVQASSNCAYGPCPAVSSVPPWEIGGLVAIAVLVLVAGVLLLVVRRRRNRKGGGGTPPAAVSAPDTGSDPEPAPPAEDASWSESTIPESEGEPNPESYRES